jgi:[ribosomal protein S18]-alanine N-acetyltransferase
MIEFTTRYADMIAAWPATARETREWAGAHAPWPPSAGTLLRWHEDDDVHPYLLFDQDEVVAYGELWTDEDEVELARLIARPDRRGQGIGRLLVGLLCGRARGLGFPVAFVRVVPGNTPALACYLAAGFAAVTPEERDAFNEGQPAGYIWLRLDLAAHRDNE